MITIAGVYNTSLIDYPKKICTSVFLRGCNFYCGFCHNPELVKKSLFNNKFTISQKKLLAFLQKRKGLIDAVCISGGEPTINIDLPEFIKKIKDIGYLIKLDTNGTNPKMLEKLIDQKLINYIAMDIKCPLNKYERISNKKTDIKNIQKSINIIKNSELNYEFRTTAIPNLLDKNDFIIIGKMLKNAKKFVLQQFRPGKTLDQTFRQIIPFNEKTLRQFATIMKKYVNNVEIRGI